MDTYINHPLLCYQSYYIIKGEKEMKYSNYQTTNNQDDASSVEWCLSAKPTTSYKQANVLLPDGKVHQYATNFATSEKDVVVVGNIFPRKQNYEIKNDATTGCMGVVAGVDSKITASVDEIAELDFVFSQKANKRMVAGCVDYLDAIGGLGGNNHTYGKNYFTGCIHPISISIRKTLAAASILAHAQFTTPENIQKAKEFLLTPNKIGLFVIHCNVFPEGYSDVDFRDIQVDVNKQNEEELANVNTELSEGIYYRGEDEKGEFDSINPYFDKYVNIGAVSIMVRGGFVNLLKAYLSVNPPIGSFYTEMLEAIGDNGYPEALSVLREHNPNV